MFKSLFATSKPGCVSIKPFGVGVSYCYKSKNKRHKT
ncbi:hypothetical protein ACUXD0_002165 [Staphylococcus hominis]